MRVAINGFGRIGRTVLKTIICDSDWGRARVDAGIDRGDLDVVALNNLGGVNETLAYLFKYDSVYGTYPAEVGVGSGGETLVVGNREFLFLNQSEPEKLPWKDLGVDVVLECTGAFTQFDKAAAHLKAGARRVVISANGKGDGPTLVLGTESMQLLEGTVSSEFDVVSCGSCTTNAAAPVVQVLHDHFGILKAQMMTVHAVTSTQSVVDEINKNLRRSRAAYSSIVPQETGAAVAVGKAIPSVGDRISGSALRVPVVCGSVVEIIAHTQKGTQAEEVNQVLRQAAEEMPGIIAVSDDELVSSDIIGLPVSSVVDAPLTEVLGDAGPEPGNLVKVYVWYDNEYAYTCRLVRLAQKLRQNR